MKFRDNTDLQRFLSSTGQCKGDVIVRFRTDDELNVTSMLSKLVMAALCEKQELLADAEVICSEPADEMLLSDFLV